MTDRCVGRKNAFLRRIVEYFGANGSTISPLGPNGVPLASVNMMYVFHTFMSALSMQMPLWILCEGSIRKMSNCLCE